MFFCTPENSMVFPPPSLWKNAPLKAHCRVPKKKNEQGVVSSPRLSTVAWGFDLRIQLYLV